MNHATRRIITALLSMSALAPGAQASDAAPSREAEMLRRTKQALQAEQEQRRSAEQEKSALAAEKAKLQEDVKKNSAQLVSQSRSARAEIERLKAELASARAANDQAQDKLKQDMERLNAQLSKTQSALNERNATQQALTALLEQNLQALASAEAKNRELHAAGLEAVAAYRRKGVGEVLSQQEPVFGFGAVQLENVAEGLRTQLDAQRVPSAFQRAAASGEVQR